MAKSNPSGKVGRSSISGKFVTVDYAKKHPKTTEIEKVQKPAKKK